LKNTLRNSSARLRVAVVAVGAVMGALVTGMASATTTYAVPADPTGGAASSVLSGAGTWITTYGAPVVAGLLLIGIIFGVLVKFARRGARAA
jgi:hypothetical protein